MPRAASGENLQQTKVVMSRAAQRPFSRKAATNSIVVQLAGVVTGNSLQDPQQDLERVMNQSYLGQTAQEHGESPDVQSPRKQWGSPFYEKSHNLTRKL